MGELGAERDEGEGRASVRKPFSICVRETRGRQGKGQGEQALSQAATSASRASAWREPRLRLTLGAERENLARGRLFPGYFM